MARANKAATKVSTLSPTSNDMLRPGRFLNSSAQQRTPMSAAIPHQLEQRLPDRSAPLLSALTGRTVVDTRPVQGNLLSALTGRTAGNPQAEAYSLRPSLPLAGRLSLFHPYWKQITQDQWVLDVVRQGYRLDFAVPPPPTRVRVTQLGGERQSALLDEVEELLGKCAIELVPPGQEKDGFYSTYFTVPKKDGGIRPILNLKLFNKCLKQETFKMETLNSIVLASQPGTWLASIDLKDAYFHVPIHPDHRKYLRFCIQGKHYQYKVTPFGLSPAPRLFTRVVLALAAWLRLRGVRIHVYLDDILLVGSSPEETSWALHLTVEVFTKAGFTINLKKSDLTPSQDLVYIGGQFRTDLGKVFLPEDRRVALTKAIQSFSRVGALHPALQWLQILGLMAATISVVRHARLHMRTIQWHLKRHWKAQEPLTKPVLVTLEVHRALQWWTNQSNLLQGLPFRQPPHDLVVTTDASCEGWGGHSLVQGQSMLFSGLWSQAERRTCHINLLELRALKLVLLRLAPYISNRVVKLECDNSTAVCYLNKQGGTRSLPLCQEAVELHRWLISHNVTVFAVHRPGVNNELADYLSRNRPDPTEWSLNPHVAQLLFRRWGSPQIDLFATQNNHRLPVWFSRTECPAAAGTNALAQSWKGWYCYAFPPTNLILRTLTKIREEGVTAIVLVPHWPRQSWYNLLYQMATETPVMFRPRLDLLSQKLIDRGTLYHPDLKTLQLTAWKLNGENGKSPASLGLSLPLLWQQSAGQHVRSTPGDGRHMSSGAQNKACSQFELL